MFRCNHTYGTYIYFIYTVGCFSMQPQIHTYICYIPRMVGGSCEILNASNPNYGSNCISKPLMELIWRKELQMASLTGAGSTFCSSLLKTRNYGRHAARPRRQPEATCRNNHTWDMNNIKGKLSRIQDKPKEKINHR